MFLSRASESLGYMQTISFPISTDKSVPFIYRPKLPLHQKIIHSISGLWLIFQKTVQDTIHSNNYHMLPAAGTELLYNTLISVGYHNSTNSLEMKRAALIIIILQSYHLPWSVFFFFYLKYMTLIPAPVWVNLTTVLYLHHHPICPCSPPGEILVTMEDSVQVSISICRSISCLRSISAHLCCRCCLISIFALLCIILLIISNIGVYAWNIRLSDS